MCVKEVIQNQFIEIEVGKENLLEIDLRNKVKRHSHLRQRRNLIERRLNDFVKQARISNREEKRALHDFFEEEEGVLYGPGIAG